MKLAVFDVCGTLYRSNTTFDFLDYYFKNHKKYAQFRKKTSNFFMLAANHCIHMLFKKDVIRKYAIGFLKGCEVKEVKQAAKQFLSEQLINKQVKDVFGLMNHYRSKGYTVVLASASLDFIINEIYQELGADEFYASELEIINGLYTGQIKNDMTHRKAEIINMNYKENEQLSVITDNLSDLQLVKLATKKHLVCWKQKHHDFWKKTMLDKVEFLDYYQ